MARWQAWLGDMLMGEGETKDEARTAAYIEYEKVDEYGQAESQFKNRDDLVWHLTFNRTY